ncbi:unnamed protein product [Sympodiomycopsis kandeliae]
MPLLQVKIEGKGNGIKTVIPNMPDIARALSRPPSYPTKFFGFELGAQTTSDEKNEKYIINGSHQADHLRNLLDDFIDKFVLCGDCKNPETDLKVPKDGSKIMRDCKACGKRSPVNMAHKLTTFISKNPPPKRVKGAKGAGKSAGQSVQEDGNQGAEGEDGNNSDDELTAKINAEAKHIPTASNTNAGDDDDEGWSVDTSEAAVKARVKALEGGLQSSLVLDDDDGDDNAADSPYNQYGLWLLDHHDASPAEVYKKAQEFGIEKKHKAVQVLIQGLFTADAVKEVEKYAPVLSRMITSEKHQKSLLGGVERLSGVQFPTLIPNGVPKLLMALYQIDVLDEEIVTDWSTKVSKKYVDKEVSKKVRKSAKPFVEWLESQDSDDDDSSSSSEEEEQEDEGQFDDL